MTQWRCSTFAMTIFSVRADNPIIAKPAPRVECIGTFGGCQVGSLWFYLYSTGAGTWFALSTIAILAAVQ